MVGMVDILVNNAGSYPLGPTTQVDEATFEEAFPPAYGSDGRG
jgi:NADP-dependent 3-hydroxy acid dehydrogenase YdfG